MSLVTSASLSEAVDDVVHIVLLLVRQRAGMAGGQQSAKPCTALSGIAEQEGGMMDEVRFQPVGGDQRFVAVAQRAFDAEAVGDIGKGHKCRAVRQRRQRQGQDGLVAAFDLAPVAAALGARRRSWRSGAARRPLRRSARCRHRRCAGHAVRLPGSDGSSSQMRAKAALCSFSRPSGPNTATASCSVSSVADWTLISVL